MENKYARMRAANQKALSKRVRTRSTHLICHRIHRCITGAQQQAKRHIDVTRMRRTNTHDRHNPAQTGAGLGVIDNKDTWPNV